MMEINKELFLDNKDFISEIFGPLDKNIKFINKELGVNIYLKEDEIYISGQKILIELAEEVVNALIEYIKKEGSIALFAEVWAGRVENDRFNALVLSASITWRNSVLLRAIAKYLKQATLPFSH